MFLLPHLEPCDGAPFWVVGQDDLTEGLVLWWPSGTTWMITRPQDPESA
jgi:hypothetical protein